MVVSTELCVCLTCQEMSSGLSMVQHGPDVSRIMSRVQNKSIVNYGFSNSILYWLLAYKMIDIK